MQAKHEKETKKVKMVKKSILHPAKVSKFFYKPHGKKKVCRQKQFLSQDPDKKLSASEFARWKKSRKRAVWASHD